MGHYLHVYHHLHQSTPCESCGAVPRKGEEIRRHCPVPETITDYLNHISTDPVKLNATSTTCLHCYKYFNYILKEPKKPASQIQSETKNIEELTVTCSQPLIVFRVDGTMLRTMKS